MDGNLILLHKLNDDGTVTYKQYNRMDPRFMVLGFIADIKENLLNINDQEKEEIVYSRYYDNYEKRI